MNADDFDMDLERRLRSIGMAAPEAPASLDGFARELVLQRRHVFPRFRLSGRPRFAWLSLAAAVAIMGALLLSALPTPLSTTGTRPEHWPWSRIEWTDISATAFPARSTPADPAGWYGQLHVVSWKGALYSPGNDGKIWTSTDGATWRAVGSPWPNVRTIRRTRDWLLGLPTDCSANGLCYIGDSSKPLYSTDGLVWQQADGPLGSIVGVASNDDRAILLLAERSADVPSLYWASAWTSTDGAHWTAMLMPEGMKQTLSPQIVSSRAGFIVSGLAPDPNGGDVAVSGYAGTTTIKATYRAWSSRDGLTWSAYEPTGLPSTAGYIQIASGSDGDELSGFHTTDGVNWSADNETGLHVSGGALGNGSLVVSFGGSSGEERLLVTSGDGQWRQLESRGSLNLAPGTCMFALLPGGLLCDSAGHVYYGQAFGS